MKKRVVPTLSENMTKFQTGGIPGKGVFDNLFFKVQLNYLRRIMEVPRSIPIHRTFLELGILPIQFETEQRTSVLLFETNTCQWMKLTLS